MKGGKFSKQVVVFVEIVTALLIIITQIFSCNTVIGLVNNDTRELLSSKAESNAMIIDKWATGKEAVLMSMITAIQTVNLDDPDLIMDGLELQLKNSDDVLMYYVCFGDDKSILPADHSYVDLDPTTRPWYIGAIEKDGFYYTEPYVDYVSGSMIVSIACPFKLNGRTAVILADITIDELLSTVNNIGANDNTEAFLLTNENNVITYPDESLLATEDGSVLITDVLNINLDSTEMTTYIDTDGREKDVMIATIPSNGWKLGVTLDEQYVLSSLGGRLGKTAIAAFILLFVFSLLMYIIMNRVLTPLVISSEALDKLSKGDFNIHVTKTKRRDEVGQLQNAVYTLTNNLTGIIGETNHILGEISNYNLVIEDMNDYPGEFDTLSNSVNQIKGILNSLLKEVQKAANGVELGSSQLAQAADSLSQGTTVQASSIMKLEADMDNVAERINRSAENCTLINTELTDLDALIRRGNDEMKELRTSVDEIERMSNDIQAIVGAIDNIAFQTNILALNASVEAARAGDNGRGFAVVAEEVRNLAGKCAEESNKTAELIAACIEAIETAKTHADSTAECLVDVVKNSAEISAAFGDISMDTKEQANSSTDIQDEIHNISDVVQSNTAAAEETAASSTELSDQANKMTSIVNNFKVDDK